MRDGFVFTFRGARPIGWRRVHVELSGNLLAGEWWEAIFAGNPSRKKGLECLGGWRYRAFGQIIGVRPVRVDCGLYVEEDIVQTSDPRVIGEYISFEITRLDALWTGQVK